jgi:hypothetical protein
MDSKPPKSLCSRLEGLLVSFAQDLCNVIKYSPRQQQSVIEHNFKPAATSQSFRAAVITNHLLMPQLGEGHDDVGHLFSEYAVAAPRAAAEPLPILGWLDALSALGPSQALSGLELPATIGQAIPDDESFCVLHRICKVLKESMRRTRDLCIESQHLFGRGDSGRKIDITRVKEACAGVAQAWRDLDECFRAVDYDDNVKRTRDLFAIGHDNLWDEKLSGDRLPPGDDHEHSRLIGLYQRLGEPQWFDQMAGGMRRRSNKADATMRLMERIVGAIREQAERPSPAWEQLNASRMRLEAERVKQKALERKKQQLEKHLQMLRDAEAEYRALLDQIPSFLELPGTLTE